MTLGGGYMFVACVQENTRFWTAFFQKAEPEGEAGD